MWYTNHFFLNFLKLIDIHYEEVVDDGLLTYHQNRKSCSISLQTETNNYKCKWRLSDKTLFERSVPPTGGNIDYDLIRDYGIRWYLRDRFDLAEFVTNPRVNIKWLEHVAPMSHGINNVSCEVEEVCLGSKLDLFYFPRSTTSVSLKTSKL